MRIITPPLIVEKNDAFSNDVLDRRAYGESLLRLIQRSNDELVIALNGKWGEGKTTFVKMWQGLLSEEDIHSIYIDAFENDYIDDAFVSIASSITAYVDSNISEDDDQKSTELKEKTKKVGGQLLSWSAKVAVKAATLGVIKESDIEELSDIKGDLAKGTSSIVGDFIEERINSHSNDLELINSFKSLLAEIPSKLHQNNNNSPLVIIIDELDRCKPSFSVEILEKVKHLFSVKNIVFILVMNKEQLEESIKSIYGQNIDSHTYLQKFISLEATIPKRIEDRYNNDLKKYSERLLQLHELVTWGDDNNIVESIEPLARHFNLSLRQLEKVYTNLAILYASSAENQLRLVPIMVFLSVIKVTNPKIFEAISYGKISFDEVCNNTGLGIDPNGQRKLNWLMSWVKYSLLTEDEFQNLAEDDPIRNFGGDMMWRYSVERERLIPIFAQKLVTFLVN